MPATALWCLRLSVAAQCIVAARPAFGGGPSKVNTWLFMAADLPEIVPRTTDQVAAYFLLIVAASVLLRPVRALVFLSAVWMAAIALATWAVKGETFYALAPLAHAALVAAPLGLALLLPGAKKSLFGGATPSRVGLWILVLGASVTFTAHGLEALGYKDIRPNQDFMTLLQGSAKHLFDWRISDSNAETILRVIGIQDLLLAALLLLFGTTGVVLYVLKNLNGIKKTFGPVENFLFRWRWVAGWMALWGFTPALLRITGNGIGFWYETVGRFANGGVPLALYLAWWQLVRPSAPPSRT